MLQSLHLGDGQNLGTADGRIALDCSIRQLKNHTPTLYTISTTDFFFPLVTSPYLQGRIGAANVLSDLYAEGVEACDFVLMLLAASRDMPVDQRQICTTHMVQGFRDACTEAGTVVTGGQTVLNPWPLIGGVATSVVSDFCRSDGAQAGHVLVLTKPLGTQVAVNVHQWRHETKAPNPKWKKILDQGILTKESASTLMHEACASMARLNRHGAQCMKQFQATAATDVTGFGLLGHAQNLCDNQKQAVGMEIHTLPCLAGSVAVNNQVFNFGLTVGTSAETSGGLLVCLPDETVAQEFIAKVQQLDEAPAWIVGRVVADESRKAVLLDDLKIVEV